MCMKLIAICNQFSFYRKGISKSVLIGKMIALLIVAFCFTAGAKSTTKNISAPPVVVKGIITDELGKPFKGVSVLIKGSSKGTSSDVNGAFQLEIPTGASKVLMFSFVGYESQEVNVNGMTSVKVMMRISEKLEKDVVVVGYGTQKKVNATGSIFTVSKEQLENRPVSNVQQALQGLVPNLVILPNNAGGEPGANMSMNLRGLQSFGGSSEPYVLVDNIPQGINDIDPNDIQSITVLKDAASAAIYGARAAYGVILITTKSGKDNRTGANVSYSANTAWSAPLNVPRSVGTMQFALAMNDAAINQGLIPWYSANIVGQLHTPQWTFEIEQLKTW